MRTFVVPLYISVDDEGGQADLPSIKDYLTEAAVIGWDSEEFGNPVGVCSMEVNWNELREA